MPVKKKRRPPVKGKKIKQLSPTIKWLIGGLVLIVLSPFYYGYVLKFGSASWNWIKSVGDDPNYPMYSGYDIRIPQKFTIHGIDVSYYQDKIDWQKVKAMSDNGVEINFAFIKATEGVARVDPYFSRNWREAPKSGLVCGAYHFFKPRLSGTAQAKFFLQVVNIEKGDLPPVIDVEELNGVSPAKMRHELTGFVKHIERKTKVKPIIYTGLSFYNDYLKGYFDDYPLWIAHYYKSKLNLSEKTEWHFWQHSDKGKVNGIIHVVDFNVFNGTHADFDRLLVK